MEIERDGPLFFQNLTHIIRSVFNAVPDHIHVAGLQLLKVTVHIGQRCRRIQKRLGLGIGQLQVLHRHHNVLPDGVLIGMVQDFLRGLAFQPVPVFVLFSGHLFIKGCIQIVGIHVIAPPHVVSVSFQGYGVAPGASSCPAPKAVRSWQPQFPAGHGPCVNVQQRVQFHQTGGLDSQIILKGKRLSDFLFGCGLLLVKVVQLVFHASKR